MSTNVWVRMCGCRVHMCDDTTKAFVHTVRNMRDCSVVCSDLWGLTSNTDWGFIVEICNIHSHLQVEMCVMGEVEREGCNGSREERRV